MIHITLTSDGTRELLTVETDQRSVDFTITVKVGAFADTYTGRRENPIGIVDSRGTRWVVLEDLGDTIVFTPEA